jgi:NMD protein affecting ribosome stability and mRNA decay
MSNPTCPNCGDSNWNEVKEGDFCENCGFKNEKFKEAESVLHIYCKGCGYHRSTWCEDHPREHQKNLYPTIIKKPPNK